MGLGGHAEVYDAELAAAALASNIARTLSQRNPEITHIQYFIDNAAAVDTIADPQPRSGQRYSHGFYQNMCHFLDENPNHRITISWCPSHCNIPGNEKVDQLAKEATNLARSSPTSTTRANALRRAKTITEKEWRIQWKKDTKSGSYAAADRIPPSLNPTRHAAKLARDRELYGRVVQCRTGHGYTGEFRRRFIPGEPVDCQCGEPIQTREHILTTCPQYEESRDILRAVSQDIVLTEILGTKEGIDALIQFLRESGAFTRTGQAREPRDQPRWEDERDPLDEEDSVEEEDFG
jgi:ribonuclease HI